MYYYYFLYLLRKNASSPLIKKKRCKEINEYETSNHEIIKIYDRYVFHGVAFVRYYNEACKLYKDSRYFENTELHSCNFCLVNLLTKVSHCFSYIGTIYMESK